jgi:hypothetical protein
VLTWDDAGGKSAVFYAQLAGWSGSIGEIWVGSPPARPWLNQRACSRPPGRPTITGGPRRIWSLTGPAGPGARPRVAIHRRNTEHPHTGARIATASHNRPYSASHTSVAPASHPDSRIASASRLRLAGAIPGRGECASAKDITLGTGFDVVGELAW